MDTQTYKRGMAAIVKLFPNKQIDFDLCWNYLKDIPDSLFNKAINEIVMGEESINAATNIIAVIRKRALESEKQTPEMAWQEVLKEVSRVGYCGRPTFADKSISDAVECIGWRSICLSECIGVERAHFFKAYDGLVKRESKKEVLNIASTPANLKIDLVIKEISENFALPRR